MGQTFTSATSRRHAFNKRVICVTAHLLTVFKCVKTSQSRCTGLFRETILNVLRDLPRKGGKCTQLTSEEISVRLQLHVNHARSVHSVRNSLWYCSSRCQGQPPHIHWLEKEKGARLGFHCYTRNAMQHLHSCEVRTCVCDVLG